MLETRHGWSYRFKALFCAALILNLNYWSGCGAGGFGSGRVVQVALTPDHPLAQLLADTSFAGAKILEVYPDSGGFRLIYDDASRGLSGGFAGGPFGLELTGLQAVRRGRTSTMDINPATKQVTRIVSPRGDEWRPDKILSAREVTPGARGAEAYAAANPELAAFVADPALMNDTLLDARSKDGAAQLDPTIILLAFLFNFCPGCIYYYLLFQIIAVIVETIVNAMTLPAGDDDGDPDPSPTPPRPPVAANDSASTAEDTPVSIAVLANDSAPDSLLVPGTLEILQPPANGNAVVDTASGIVTYTPDPDFNGSDSFGYGVCDNGVPSQCTSALVSITVLPENDPPTANDDSGSAVEDGPPVEIAFAELLQNDTDPDAGDVLSVVGAGTSASGADVTLVGDNVVYDHTGLFQELPEGGNATDTFAYTVSDQAGEEATATVTMTITGVNDAPVAVDDEGAAQEDGPPVALAIQVLLSNDSDVDVGDVLSLAGVSNSAAGANVTVVGDDVIYDAAGLFQDIPGGGNVTDTFTYTVTDFLGATATATVTMTVSGANDPPTAGDDMGEAIEDGPAVAFGISALLANDSDPDAGDVLNVIAVTDSAGGAVVSIAGTDVIYDHAGLFQELADGANTSDTFTYTAADTSGATATATVTVTVVGVNDPPVAEDDMVGVSKDVAPVTFPAGLFLANDTDIDAGDVLTIVNATDSDAGAIVDIVGGDIVYDHTGLFEDLPEGANATDMFTYTVQDLAGATATATVTVLISGVNQPPVARDDGGQAVEDGPVVNLPIVDLLSNDFDPDAGDVVSLQQVNNSAAGAVVSIAGADVTYDHTGLFQELAQGAGATDTFTYTVQDTAGATATATVTMTVSGVNDPPTAGDDDGAATEDGGPVTLPAAEILANDSDVDIGDVLTISNVTDSAAGAGVEIVAGDIVYDPGELFQELGEGETTTDTFTYTIQDIPGAMSTATVTVTVTGVNDPPLAGDDLADVLKDAGPLILSIAQLLSNDMDPDGGDVLSVVGVTNSDAGAAVSIVGSDVVYDFADLFAGLGDGESSTDTFTYTVEDASGASSTATVTVTINGSNDPPVAAKPSSLEVDEDAQDVSLGIAAPTDPDAGDALTITVTGLPDPAIGVVTLSTGTPVAVNDVLSEGDLAGLQLDTVENASGAAGMFTYDVSDGIATVGGSATIDVRAVADAPLLAVTDAAGGTDEQIALDIQAALVDTDGSETLSIVIENVPLDAVLTEGIDEGGGRWVLLPTELPGLAIVCSSSGTFPLSVTATATEASNANAAISSQTLTLTVESGAAFVTRQ